VNKLAAAASNYTNVFLEAAARACVEQTNQPAIRADAHYAYSVSLISNQNALGLALCVFEVFIRVLLVIIFYVDISQSHASDSFIT